MDRAERRRRIDELLRDTLDQPVEQRDRFLSDACRGDDDDGAQQEVRRLLQTALEDGDFLQPGGAQLGGVWDELLCELAGEDGTEGEPEASAVAGDRIGSYRIIRELGHGGMGTVYLAQHADDAAGSLVALKVLAPGLHDEDVARRFQQERHILATLDHPAIARHIDGGVTGEGRPYLVMEYVDGEPIDHYCDRHQLNLEQRLQLFMEVARAVQYAHRCMVVHRDLKPSNILVTEDNQVKLLDFGIAKLLDQGAGALPEPLTRTGLRVMTPEYASPEQVRGGLVTTATDVYQLGMVLYELLTGRRPYRLDGRSPGEVEQLICEQEPILPSTAVKRSDTLTPAIAADGLSTEVVSSNRRLRPERLRARLRGDLDLIVMMALRKEPERRYLSVDQLIQDLQRHLAGHPISARKDTLGYRIGKFVRRHRIGLTASATIVLLIVLLIGLYIDRQIAKHEQTRREAEQSEQVAAFLEGLFDVAEPGPGAGEQISAKELLDHGAERITSDLAHQPQLQATLQGMLGDMYRKLGSYEQARSLLEQALDTRRTTQADSPAELAASLDALGRLDLDTGRFSEAESLFHEAMALQRQTSGEDSLEMARSRANLAELAVATGKLEEAEPLYRQALQTLESKLGANHQEVAKTLAGLSSLYWSQGRYEEAEPLLQQALRIHEQAANRDDRLYAIALSDLGQLYARQGELDRAEEQLRRGYEVLEQHLGSEHPDTALALKAIARVLAEQGRLDEAEPLLHQALATLQEAHQGSHPDIGDCLHDLGLLYWDRGDLVEAERLLKEALAIGEETLGDDHPDVAAALNSLGALYLRQGRLGDAAAAYRRALAIVEATLGSDHPHVAVVLVNLAGVLGDQGEYDEAIALCERAVHLNEQLLGPDHIDVAHSRCILATLYADCGRFAEAETLLRSVLRVQEEYGGPQHPMMVSTLRLLCSLLTDLGSYDEALSSCERAQEIGRRELAPEDPEVANTEAYLASLLLRLGEPQRAEPLLRRSIATMEQVLPPESPEQVPLQHRLIEVLLHEGRSTEAELLLRRAADLLSAHQDLLTPEQLFDQAEIYLALGKLEAQAGRAEQARRFRTAALALVEPFRDRSCAVRWQRIIAMALDSLGRSSEARPLLDSLRALGYVHPDLG